MVRVLTLPVSHFSAAEKLTKAGQPACVLVAVLKNIQTSTAEIKNALPKLGCALVNASLVASQRALTSGVMRVFAGYTTGSMKTRSPSTELLYALSPSTNVTESLETFGISSDTAAVIAVRFFDDNIDSFIQDLESRLTFTFEDIQISIDTLCLTDFSRIQALYRIQEPANTDRECCTIIATKGI
jgi:tRNA threonylcarbamoyladenosine modification (KEOPS) complex Cgi121 subunit